MSLRQVKNLSFCSIFHFFLMFTITSPGQPDPFIDNREEGWKGEWIRGKVERMNGCGDTIRKGGGWKRRVEERGEREWMECSWYGSPSSSISLFRFKCVESLHKLGAGNIDLLTWTEMTGAPNVMKQIWHGLEDPKSSALSTTHYLTAASFPIHCSCSHCMNEYYTPFAKWKSVLFQFNYMSTSLVCKIVPFHLNMSM